MKEEINIIIISSILIILLISISYINLDKKSYIIAEEALPIRDNEKIIGMDYIITIPLGTRKNKLLIEPKIIESVEHYKELNNLKQFIIKLKINNNSNYSYLLKDISLVSKASKEPKRINYQKSNNNIITFQLNNKILKNYYNNYNLQIKLEK